MTRRVFTLLLVSASTAWADVGPRPPRCVVPATCTTCELAFSEPDAGRDCRAGALDAGYTLSDCSDRTGSVAMEYYCPAGQSAVRGCGCSAVEGLGGVSLLLLLGLRRRRR